MDSGPVDFQQLLSSIFEQAATGMAMVSPERRFLAVNQAYCQLTGYTAEELAGIDSLNLTQMRDRAGTLHLYNRLAANEISDFREEKRYARKDGEIVWVRNSVSAVRDAAGHLLYVLVITEDITGRKNAEAAHQSAEERLRIAAAHTSEIIYEWDIPQITPGGYGERKLRPIRNPAQEQSCVIHSEDCGRVTAAIARHLETGEPFFEQYRVSDGGGGWRYWEDRGSAMRREDGTAYRWVGVATDVTERRRTEEALSRLAAIVQSSEDAIIGITLEGTISDWNLAAERLYGYPEDQVRGMPFSILFSPKDLGELAREFSGFPVARALKVEDAICCRSDGTEVHVSLSISPVKDVSGRRIGAAAIARDISELQQMNESLQHLSGELLRSQDEERRRIARELHDSTAQGLAGVAMNLAVLERSRIVAAEPRESKLVGEALALARQCAKEVRALSYLLHPPLLDELGLASALRSYAEGFSDRTGIQLNLELPPNFGRFPAEIETTLFRIVQECLANVHHHSGSPQAAIRIRHSAGQVSLDVEDEGHGLLQGALESSGRGTVRLGVGIPGMRERARQLGGKLEILSGRQGTRVRVVLPLPGRKEQPDAGQQDRG